MPIVAGFSLSFINKGIARREFVIVVSAWAMLRVHKLHRLQVEMLENTLKEIDRRLNLNLLCDSKLRLVSNDVARKLVLVFIYTIVPIDPLKSMFDQNVLVLVYVHVFVSI